MRISALRTLLIVVVVLGVAAVLAGASTYSKFSVTSSNTGNSFVAGTVALSDNDGGTTFFTLSNLKPTSPTSSKCIAVSYSGTLSATVRLYGTSGGTGLAQYLNLKVTRGTGNNSSCIDFAADAPNYISQGAGVIYNGTLSGYPTTYAGGIVDPTSGSPNTWTNPQSHTYRLDISLQNNTSAQGLNATQDFTWEARNQ